MLNVQFEEKKFRAQKAFKRRYGDCVTGSQRLSNDRLRIEGNHGALWLDFDISAWRIRCVGGGSLVDE